MNFDVYCDEALPDLLTSRKPRGQFLMIGSLWLPAEMRVEAKRKIATLRASHEVWGELKWTKISRSKQAFYEELIDVFMSFGSDMRFRCIAVDREQFNPALHQNDGELGFYKFYYQLLHHWILERNDYRVFCDLKTSRDRKRLHDLKRILGNSNRYASIVDVQSLPSPEVALMQLCDVLLGASSSRMNGTLGSGTAKEAVVRRLEERLGCGQIGPTPVSEAKFNVFKIRLAGGW